MPDVYLARHGQTASNLERRFQGRLPVPLDETGRAQAAELAGRAMGYGFQALWCSSLLRARQTADVVGERLGLEAREDDRLVETDSGDWTDRTFAEVQAEDPERFAEWVGGDPDFAFPGGESFAQQADRVGAALADVERDQLPALVICHGVVIRIALVLRAGDRSPLARPVPNGALIPWVAEAAQAEPGVAALPPS